MTLVDPYEIQDTIEQVSDKLIEGEAAAAVALIARKYGLDLYEVAEQVEQDG